MLKPDPIPAEEFEDIGRKLEIGQRTRVPHDCGSGNVMIVSRDSRGIRAWCFREKRAGFVSTAMSAKERIAKLLENQKADASLQTSLELPSPVIKDMEEWPEYAQLWLFRAGFDRDWVSELGWYYNPRMDRVILPVYDRGRLVFWQGRAFDKGRPKYLSPQMNRGGILAFYGSHDDDTLVLTEDILSAAKVGRSFNAASLLGTSLSDGMLVRILQEKPSHVLVSLDPDEAGIVGARLVQHQLSMVGVRATTCILPRDPKLVSRQEIEDAFLREFE